MGGVKVLFYSRNPGSELLHWLPLITKEWMMIRPGSPYWDRFGDDILDTRASHAWVYAEGWQNYIFITPSCSTSESYKAWHVPIFNGDGRGGGYTTEAFFDDLEEAKKHGKKHFEKLMV